MKANVVFDRYGLVSVHCSTCGETVKQRTEVASAKYPGKYVYAMMRMINFRQDFVELSDGSVMEPIFCAGCINKPKDYDKVMEVVKAGWEEGDRVSGKSEDSIKFSKDRVNNLRIVGKPAKEKMAKIIEEKEKLNFRGQ